MESADGSKISKRTVFVTVGTTLFDALVKAVDTPEVKHELYAKGYTHLLIQIGRGSYIPARSTGDDGSLAIEYFTFSSSIAESLSSASLVISHAAVIESGPLASLSPTFLSLISSQKERSEHLFRGNKERES